MQFSGQVTLIFWGYGNLGGRAWPGAAAWNGGLLRFAKLAPYAKGDIAGGFGCLIDGFAQDPGG